MTFRQLRRRWTPAWFGADARRRVRDRAFRQIGIQRCHAPSTLTRRPEMRVQSLLPFVVARELLSNRDITFIQIGACDGIGDDDLHTLISTHSLRGVLVEPQPAAFERLQALYRHQPHLTLLQAAIAEREGTRELYCRRGAISQAASFDRKHLQRHGIAADEIIAIEVPCHTVESALRAAGLDRADLIQIDTEGYDWAIIRSLDLKRLRPSIIRFEYRHLSGRDVDDCLDHLANHGYRFLVEQLDIIAVRANA